jgi:predicted nucleotidyltransferase
MPSPPDRVFHADAILHVLAKHGLDFVVIGGVAVQGHGYLRGTHDLDIIVRPTTLHATRLSEALAELEAELRVPGGLSLDDPHQLRNAPLIPTVTKFGPLDVVNIQHVAGPPKSYEALRQSALVIPLDSIEVPVAGLSDLIRMKRAAGRDQDLADIEALTRDLEVDPEST